MSKVESNLCSVLLRERYGPIVQKVGTYLMYQIAPQPLILICKNVSLRKKEVQYAVHVLVVQSLAQCFTNARGVVEITVKCEWVINVLFHTHCSSYSGQRFGEKAELLFEEVCFESALPMSQAIENVAKSLYQSKGEEISMKNVKELQKLFEDLIQKRLICRGHKPELLDNERVPITERELHAVPEIDPNMVVKIGGTDSGERPAKRMKIDDAKTYPDSEIFWVIDWERMDCFMRNEVIISAALNIVDEKASQIIKVMLEISETAVSAEKKLWTPTSPPVSYRDVLHKLKTSYNIGSKTLDNYLAVLTEGDYCFVAKADERSGGVYVVNTTKIVQKLTEETVASVVQEKYGSDYSRIFRLLLKNKYLEQSKLEEFSLLSPKDVKTFTYKLLRGNFVVTQEIARTPDYAPTRTIYLFYVDLYAVCQRLLSDNYMTIMNLLSFLMSFKKDNQRLTEKKARQDTIIAILQQNNASQEEIDNVIQAITPMEEEEFQRIQLVIQGINKQVIDIIDSVILLKAYLKLTPRK